jgi:hypothetical protein
VLQVEICINDHIDEGWSDWFESLTITHTEDDQTILTGSVVDQTALYSLIARLSRLGLALVFVKVT